MLRVTQAISRLIRRAFTSLASTHKDGELARVQISYQGGSANAQLWEPYGLSSAPPVGTYGLTISPSGNADDAIILASPLQSGNEDLKSTEVKLYNPSTKSFIKIDADGNIIINASKDVNVIVNGTVNLGEGGKNIARLDDDIEVTITSGSSAGTYSGKITSAGNNTST